MFETIKSLHCFNIFLIFVFISPGASTILHLSTTSTILVECMAIFLTLLWLVTSMTCMTIITIMSDYHHFLDPAMVNITNGHKWAFPGPGHQSNAFIVTLKIQPSLVGNQCQSETHHQALHAALVWFSLSPLSTTMKRSPCWQVGLDLCSECCGSSPLVGLGVVGTSSPIGLDWEFGKYHVDIHLFLLVIDGRYTSLAILIPS